MNPSRFAPLAIALLMSVRLMRLKGKRADLIYQGRDWPAIYRWLMEHARGPQKWPRWIEDATKPARLRWVRR